MRISGRVRVRFDGKERVRAGGLAPSDPKWTNWWFDARVHINATFMEKKSPHRGHSLS